MNPIRLIRKTAGLSQMQLAAMLEVSQSAISQYERGAIQPSIKQAKCLVALAADAGLSISLDQVYELPGTVQAAPAQEPAHA